MIAPYYEDAASGITIYHGDCRDVLPTLAPVDLLLTDPPYGILNLQGNGSTPCVRKSRRQQGSGTLKNRLLNRSNVEWDIAPTAIELDAAFAKSNKRIVWGGNYFPLPPTRAVLVWDKCQPWPNFSQVEVAWTDLERPAALFKHDKSDIDGKIHPTQKPEPLMRWCIGLAGESVKTILDPYMGSGTTLLAAKMEGRRAIGIEIEERYCEIAANRLRQGVLFGLSDND